MPFLIRRLPSMIPLVPGSSGYPTHTNVENAT